MIIAFHTPTIDERGTCVALYDYAHYNEKLLKNESLILIPKSSYNTSCVMNAEVLKKFSSRFVILYYESEEDLESICEFCDVLYCIKYGKRDSVVSKKIKTVVHCVFDMSEPHGDVYAGVSEQLSKKFGSGVYVPHMVNFDIDESVSKNVLRKSLGIPESATVFGRHGGCDTFDIPWVKNMIERVVRINPTVYFIFVNTPRFSFHPNIYFLEKIVDIKKKKEFISSCDAMIHGQSLGESFGLSISEFSVYQKPIICYGNWVLNDNYKKILGEKALYYHDDIELLKILFDFDKREYENRVDLNCYENYSPAKVMEIFEKVFLS